MLLGGGLCHGPILRPEESYRVCVCVCACALTLECDQVCNSNPLHLQRVGSDSVVCSSYILDFGCIFL